MLLGAKTERIFVSIKEEFSTDQFLKKNVCGDSKK